MSIGGRWLLQVLPDEAVQPESMKWGQEFFRSLALKLRLGSSHVSLDQLRGEALAREQGYDLLLQKSEALPTLRPALYSWIYRDCTTVADTGNGFRHKRV
jgi:hypothetical protein